MADCGRPRGEEARPLNKKTALLISLAAGILLLVALVLVQGSFHSGGGIRLPVGTADTDSDNEQGSVGGLDVSRNWITKYLGRRQSHRNTTAF